MQTEELNSSEKKDSLSQKVTIETRFQIMTNEGQDKKFSLIQINQKDHCQIVVNLWDENSILNEEPGFAYDIPADENTSIVEVSYRTVEDTFLNNPITFKIVYEEIIY